MSRPQARGAGYRDRQIPHHHVDVDKLDYVRRDAAAAKLGDAVPYDPEAMLESVRWERTRWAGAATMAFAARQPPVLRLFFTVAKCYMMSCIAAHWRR